MINIQTIIKKNIPTVYYLYRCLNLCKENNTKTTIIIVSEKTMKQIMYKFYVKKYTEPTNVLCFNNCLLEKNKELLLNQDEIILCYKTIKKESKYLKKNFFTYWQQLINHGFLHLNSYTHYFSNDKYTMELIEKKLEKKLNYN